MFNKVFKTIEKHLVMLDTFSTTMQFSGSIKSKLPGVGTTIFSVMSALANEQQAINLAQGFPDFNCHPALIDLVTKAMKAGHNQYAPMPGVLALREQIAIKTQNLYGAIYHPEKEITVVPGGTHALYAAISAIISEGDEGIYLFVCENREKLLFSNC